MRVLMGISQHPNGSPKPIWRSLIAPPRLRGRSRTDFVREAAVRAAEAAPMENAPVRLSPEGFEAFMAILAAPTAPVPEMAELFKRQAPWESGGAHD